MTDIDQVTLPRSEFNKIIDIIHSIKLPESLDPKRLLTIKEASRYLKCSTVSLWKIRKEANLTPTYVGKKIFFQKHVLDQYLGINHTFLFTSRELKEKFNIERLTLLQWEIAGKVRCHIVGVSIKYPITEVYAALKADKKEDKT
jgi:hypothetical protein